MLKFDAMLGKVNSRRPIVSRIGVVFFGGMDLDSESILFSWRRRRLFGRDGRISCNWNTSITGLPSKVRGVRFQEIDAHQVP